MCPDAVTVKDPIARSHRIVIGLGTDAVEGQYPFRAADTEGIKTWATSQPKISLERAKEKLAPVLSPAQMHTLEGILGRAAIHPTIEGHFPNPLYQAVGRIAAPEALQALAKAKGQYTYINQEQLAHHPGVGLHTLAVGVLCHALGTLMGIRGDELQTITYKAALHDSYKLADMLAVRLRDLHIPANQVMLREGEESKGILQQAMLFRDDEIELMLEGGKFVAHPSIQLFLKRDAQGRVSLRQDDLAAICVHLADEMTWEHTPLPGSYRMAAAGFSYPEGGGLPKYPDLWNRGLFMNQQGLFFDRPLRGASAGETLVGRFIDLQIVSTYAMAQAVIDIGVQRGIITDNELESAKHSRQTDSPPGLPPGVYPDTLLYWILRNRNLI